MKRNKIRYQSEEKPKVILIPTGNIYLRYEDEEAIASAQKGDFLVYPYNALLNAARQGEYESIGFSGYFKVDVFDGKKWCLVLLGDIFPKQENHFSKKERPMDTYQWCKKNLSDLAGKPLLRTYREHYTLDVAGGSKEEA